MDIVVVDDSYTARQALEGILGALDHRVRSFSETEEALTWLGQNAPDVVLCDYIMEGNDGVDFFKAMRAIPRHQETAFVIVSGLVNDDLRAVCQTSGIRWILPKPFNVTTVSDLMERLEATRKPADAPRPVPTLAPVPKPLADLCRTLSTLSEAGEFAVVGKGASSATSTGAPPSQQLDDWIQTSSRLLEDNLDLVSNLIVETNSGTQISLPLDETFRLTGILNRFVAIGVVRFYVARTLALYPELATATPPGN